MLLDWRLLPRPIIALSPMADMTDSAFCRVVKAVTQESKVSATGGSAPGGEGQKSNPEIISPKIFDFGLWTLDFMNNYPIVFREMVSSEAVVRGNNKTLDMTDIHPDERPLVQQLFGSDPAVMAEAARIIAAQHHPEGFDINMGCPVYKIVHNFNGAALMKEPELATKIVKAIKAVIDVPLSVKIRLGWSDPTECLTFAKILENAGVDLLTIHGRTKAQGYSGVADWDMLRRVKEAVNIPVLANGDIHQASIIDKALQVSQADGVLIARGALGNPWIFRDYRQLHSGGQINYVSLEERLEVVRFHLKLHLEQYGSNSVNTFRKHLSWYLKGQSHFKQFKEPLMKAATARELEPILASIH